MGSFNRGKSSDRGPKTFAKKRFSNEGFGGKSSMHEATCSSCGKDCKVPFRPTGSRPIFCSVCFDKQGSGNSERPHFGDKRKREFQKETAVYESKSADLLKAEFARLHAKLDSILDSLNLPVAEEKASDDEEVKEKAPFKMKNKVTGSKKSSKK